MDTMGKFYSVVTVVIFFTLLVTYVAWVVWLHCAIINFMLGL